MLFGHSIEDNINEATKRCIKVKCAAFNIRLLVKNFNGYKTNKLEVKFLRVVFTRSFDFETTCLSGSFKPY